MIIPEYAWKRKIGKVLDHPGKTKIFGDEGGLPNIDDGYFLGMPLGGFGGGTLAQTFNGDFSVWHLEPGKHVYKNLSSCHFGISEGGKTIILNNAGKQSGTYYALYPTAYFEYPELNIIQEQFSPIIPHNYKETSYPIAVFKWHVSNPDKKERELSIFWSWESFFETDKKNFYSEDDFSGLVFSNLNSKEPNKRGQMGIFIQNKGLGVKLLKDSSGISTTIKLNPKETQIITFVLAWYFPIVEFKSGTQWLKYYTKFFGTDGKNVIKIANEAFQNSEKWLAEIKKWQSEYLKTDKPDWFKTMLINELYYLAHGGTLWIYNVTAKEEHFGILECFDYLFYETLDVRFYGSFPLLKLWPRLEKIVMRDYFKTIDLENKDKVFFNHPLIQKEDERKQKGAVPHDLGSPKEDPFIKINAYDHVNINIWKDLNSKFILLVYRDFYLTGQNDIEFLSESWHAVVEAIKYLKQFDRDNDCLIENDNIPDQTYDNWSMHGPSTYCNGLWLAALKAAIEIAKVLNKNYKLFQSWFEIGKLNLESKLWNDKGEYYLFDIKSPHKNCIMADQLCGQWYADMLGLGDVFDKDRVSKTLKKIFEFNVMKVKSGTIGAINGINPDGSLLPESKVWKLNTQSNEIWTGVTLGLSSFMELRGLKKEALKTAHGIYKVVYEDKGYWFRTPEAWDINGDFRASMYHRAGAVWAFTGF